jgi:hypothetical protein
MNRKEDRWRHCYWKEWAAIKKRWDEVHTAWRQIADDCGSRTTEMKHALPRAHRRKA